MRLAGQKKAGFYPTPNKVVRYIAKYLSLEERPYFHFNNNPYSFLDPTAGTGEALATLAELLSPTKTKTWGIELERNRAKIARTHLNHVYTGDARNFEAKNFALLYLNPPYDSDNGQRLELEFLKRYTPALLTGGVLVFIIPETYLNVVSPYLTAHYENLRVFRFPAEHYQAFKQVVIFGTRRYEPVPEQDKVLAPIGNLESGYFNLKYGYTVPYHPIGKPSPIVRPILQKPEDALRLAKTSPAWDAFQQFLPSRTQITPFRPLAPLSEGHLALLLAAGYLNSTLLMTDEGPILMKGRVTKAVEKIEEEDRIIEREYFKPVLYAWNLETGELKELT